MKKIFKINKKERQPDVLVVSAYLFGFILVYRCYIDILHDADYYEILRVMRPL